MGRYDKSKSARGASQRGSRKPQNDSDLPLQLQTNSEYRKIAAWLTKVKFRPKLVGGLDPLDVWKKIEELNEMYEKALMAERVRCDMVIERVRENARVNGWISTEDDDG
ncbi:MAG: hypothetical protein IJE81_04520 [Oscillospiraceae bacterium]|nr:hypothetical protein [Oscillospiraceae bacterium]MBQ7130373.1 hypothetical protein [Oscillospiraceae bacterium]